MMHYKRKVLGSLPNSTPSEVDLMSIDDWLITQLTLFDNVNSYGKHKESCKESHFLA